MSRMRLPKETTRRSNAGENTFSSAASAQAEPPDESICRIDPCFPVAGATEVQTFDWIQTLTASDRILVEALSNELDIGEAEAIVLAVEIQADQVLINEHQGGLGATRLNLRCTGILGILVEAKSQGLIAEVKPLLDVLVNQADSGLPNPYTTVFYDWLTKLTHSDLETNR